MYVTKPRSLYRNNPGALYVQPLRDAPYSGQLVVSDEKSGGMGFSCYGICRNNRIKRLPFPQDRILKVVNASVHEDVSITKVWFIPVVGQPLSSNRYYVIKAKGRHKGQAYTCSREDAAAMCCFNNVQTYRKTRPFDYRDRCQQVEIHRYHNGGFFAKSVDWDGYPPSFLRTAGWEVYTVNSYKFHLSRSPGLNNSLLQELPELNVPLYSKCSTPIIIGKWYCPCVFVKEEAHRVKDQMRKSVFYELSLNLWWEQIYSCENELVTWDISQDIYRSSGNLENNVVVVNKRVKRLVSLVCGVEAEKDEDRLDAEGFVWFKIKEQHSRRVGVGLNLAILEKIRLLQETRGWFDGHREVIIKGRKEVRNDIVWRKFGCYVLVEGFVLSRMDGSVLINFNFRNTSKIECRWE
ncbi:hypothetical protein Fot_05776 [Forsythia ovata]|uniref:Uncharacterized protein n=1 Tax=Forsythia ovata TaxID=205694 RepID=A0ABD1WR28_9LAMI